MIDIVLRAGSTLVMRAAVRDDVDRLVAFTTELSQESRYYRFLGIPIVNRGSIERLVPDTPSAGMAVVGESAGRIVAFAGYYPVPGEASRAEVALASRGVAASRFSRTRAGRGCAVSPRADGAAARRCRRQRRRHLHSSARHRARRRGGGDCRRGRKRRGKADSGGLHAGGWRAASTVVDSGLRLPGSRGDRARARDRVRRVEAEARGHDSGAGGRRAGARETRRRRRARAGRRLAHAGGNERADDRGGNPDGGRARGRDR